MCKEYHLCRSRYTSVGSGGDGEGAAQRIDWKEPLEPFLVQTEQALLCIELRNRRSVGHDCVRLPGEKLSRLSRLQGQSYDRIGAVCFPFEVAYIYEVSSAEPFGACHLRENPSTSLLELH
jgi:hypothetical protein